MCLIFVPPRSAAAAACSVNRGRYGGAPRAARLSQDDVRAVIILSDTPRSADKIIPNTSSCPAVDVNKASPRISEEFLSSCQDPTLQQYWGIRPKTGEDSRNNVGEITQVNPRMRLTCFPYQNLQGILHFLYTQSNFICPGSLYRRSKF